MSPEISGYIDERGQPVIVDPQEQVRVKNTIPVDLRGILNDMAPLGVTAEECVLLFAFLSVVDLFKSEQQEAQQQPTIN